MRQDSAQFVFRAGYIAIITVSVIVLALIDFTGSPGSQPPPNTPSPSIPQTDLPIVAKVTFSNTAQRQYLTGNFDIWQIDHANQTVTALLRPSEQTALLEAEFAAAAGDHATAETKYNSGVKAHMQIWGSHYDASLAVDDATVDAYLLANPYDSTEAERMIGEQYWAASFLDFFEAYSNFRRSGYPALLPFGGENPHPSNTTNGAIPRRLIYPSSEASVNTDNFQAVLQAQGPNDQVTRVWWDVN